MEMTAAPDVATLALPSDLLKVVLSKLDSLHDIARAKCVCKQWRTSISGVLGWPTLQEVDMYGPGVQQAVQLLATKCPNVTALNASGLVNEQASMLGALLPSLAKLQDPLPSLRSLDMSHTSLGGILRGFLGHGYLPRSCLQHVSGLTRLQLSHTKGTLGGQGKTSASDILEACPNLLHLELDHSNVAAGMGEQWLQPRQLPLQHLSWAGCAHAEHDLFRLLPCLQQLTYLDLSHSNVGPAIRAVARECWKLQVLLLASCPALTDDALADLAGAQQTTGSLRQLSLRQSGHRASWGLACLLLNVAEHSRRPLELDLGVSKLQPFALTTICELLLAKLPPAPSADISRTHSEDQSGNGKIQPAENSSLASPGVQAGRDHAQQIPTAGTGSAGQAGPEGSAASVVAGHSCSAECVAAQAGSEDIDQPGPIVQKASSADRAPSQTAAAAGPCTGTATGIPAKAVVSDQHSEAAVKAAHAAVAAPSQPVLESAPDGPASARQGSVQTAQCQGVGDSLLPGSLPTTSAQGPVSAAADSRLDLMHFPEAQPSPACTEGPLAALHLDSCPDLDRSSLKELASPQLLQGLRVLNLSSLPCLGAGASSQEAAAEAASTLAAILSCAPQLRQLYLDELLVSETACKALGQVCVNLEDASLVACKRMTDTGLQYIAQGCQKMRSLSIGGAASSFSEATGLGAFTQLTKLVLVRRPTCTDTEFQGLMSSLRGLQEVKLASLSRITDTGLAALPAGLTSLTLVMCENVKGASLARLTRLRELRLRHCPAMNPQHLQVAALSCTRLRLVELPEGLSASSMPQQAAGLGHLSRIKYLTESKAMRPHCRHGF